MTKTRRLARSLVLLTMSLGSCASSPIRIETHTTAALPRNHLTLKTLEVTENGLPAGKNTPEERLIRLMFPSPRGPASQGTTPPDDGPGIRIWIDKKLLPGTWPRKWSLALGAETTMKGPDQPPRKILAFQIIDEGRTSHLSLYLFLSRSLKQLATDPPRENR